MKKTYQVNTAKDICEFLSKQRTKYFTKKYPGMGESTSLTHEHNFEDLFIRVRTENKPKKMFFMVVPDDEGYDFERPITELKFVDFDPTIGDIVPASFEAAHVEETQPQE